MEKYIYGKCVAEVKKFKLLDNAMLPQMLKEQFQNYSKFYQMDTKNQRFPVGLMAEHKIWVSDDFDAPIDDLFECFER